MAAPAPAQPYGFPPGAPSAPPSGQESLGTNAPSPFLPEKSSPAYPSAPAPSSSRFGLGFLNPVVQPFANAANSIGEARAKLGLPNPGTVEHLQREVKSTHLTNFMFDGARADLTKAFSINPIFQVTHAFSLGSQSAPPAYNFGAVVGDSKNFFQAGVDDGGSVTVRANRGWTAGNVSKLQAQLTSTQGQSFVQLEHDYQGSDHSANIKALNPSPSDGTGIYIVNFLQSLTRNFALGVETIYQRPSVDMEEASTGYMAKYTSDARDWIATAQMQGAGVLQATYWQKLSDKVDIAADLQLLAVGQRREAVATLGSRWDFRMANFRAQVDSTGKVSALLEQRFTPIFGFTVAGEIDHFKNAAKFGIGIQIESGSMPEDPNAPSPTPPSVPM